MFHHLPGSALANGKLAELAEHVGRMVEHLRSKSTQPNYPTTGIALDNMTFGLYDSLAILITVKLSKLYCTPFNSITSDIEESFLSWEQRYPRILSEIRSWSPDVLCMQGGTNNILLPIWVASFDIN